MRTPLDAPATMLFAQRKLQDRLRPSGLTFWAHACEVSRRVDALARWFYGGGGFLSPSVLLQIEELRHAGWLHELISECGCGFEELCDEADYRVSSLVASCSPDKRLPCPQRHLELRGRLSEAETPSQILALSDILASVQDAQEWFRQSPTIETDDALVVALGDLDGDLASLNKLTHVGRLRPHLRTGREAIEQLLEAVQQRQRGRSVRERITSRRLSQARPPRLRAG